MSFQRNSGGFFSPGRPGPSNRRISFETQHTRQESENRQAVLGMSQDVFQSPVGRRAMGSFVPASYDRYAGRRYSSMSGVAQRIPLRDSTAGLLNTQTILEEDADYDKENHPEDRIWGTHITADSVLRRFKNFMENFEPNHDNDDIMEDREHEVHTGKYMKMLATVINNQESYICIEGDDIRDHDPVLFEWFCLYPLEVFPFCDMVVSQLSRKIDDQMEESIEVKVKLRQSKTIQDLNPTDIDKLIAVQGMVTRTSNITPVMRGGLFVCEGCGREEVAQVDQGNISEPETCEECMQKFSFRLIHNRSSYGNKQLVKMQESPDAIPEGETPHSVTLYVYDSLVDYAKPGDRITVTGVFRADSVRENPRMRSLKSVYKTYVDVIHIARDESTDFEDRDLFENMGSQIARTLTALEDEMVALSLMDNLYDELTRSLAPSIWGMDDVKRGILCQLFGGTSLKHNSGQVRGEINILLVGDPGVSKSQLLSHVHKIAPRGIYVSGQGSSAVGLTAYIARDPDTREPVLEPGALVLSDKGVCCIDEFDKMSDSARSMLHEVMEQQTVSVAKAGIISVLKARTSILAAANPIGSKYNQKLSVKANINLPPTLMSRFDLIYLLLDSHNKEMDKRLAHHIISLFGDEEPEEIQAPISREKLRDYITYAKERANPRLTRETVDYLSDQYRRMRQVGMSRHVITATPRQLESLIRLSEALARMKLRNQVQIEDCEEAVRLMNVSLMQSAIDPITGTIDIGILQTGRTETEREMERRLPDTIKGIIDENGEMSLASLHEVLEAQSTVPITISRLKEILRGMDSINFDSNVGRIFPFSGDE